MTKERATRQELPLPSALIERLEEHPSFTRGLALGMLVGAAIAGSTIWSRLRGSEAGRAGDTAPKERSRG
jgi:hypothetical protein